jgi:hypothetical protein
VRGRHGTPRASIFLTLDRKQTSDKWRIAAPQKKIRSPGFSRRRDKAQGLRA